MVVPIVAPSAPQQTDDSNFGGPNAAQMAAAAAATKTQPVPQANSPQSLAQLESNEGYHPAATPGMPGYNPAGNQPTFSGSQKDIQPPSEPTVLSSGNIADTVIPNNTSALANLSNKGQYSQDGVVYNSDGTLAPASDADANAPQQGQIPAGGIDNGDGTYSLNGLTYTNAPDPQTAAINANIASLKGSLDATTKASIDAIEKQYAQLIGQQTQINSQAAGARNAALLTGGTSRYSPDTASGIMQTQLSYGLQQIAKLDSDENTAIAQANAAQQSGDSQLADKLISDAQSLRTQKQTIANQLNDALSKANTAALANQRISSIGTSVAGLIQQGMTDPADILSAINSYDDGTSTGANLTTDELSSMMNDILTNTGAGTVKNLTGDVKNFTALQQAGSLPASIAALPEEQQLAAYISMIHSADKGNLSNALANAGGLTTNSSGQPVATDSSGDPISVTVDDNNIPDKQAQATFLASLPGGIGGGVSTLVQGLADYSINPTAFTTKNYAGATGMTQSQALALAKQYNPLFDEKKYQTAQAMQKNVASGTYSNTITAANTLISHLNDLNQDLKDLYDPKKGGLNNGGFLSTVGNKAKIGEAALSGGNQYVKKFLTDAQAVSTEAATVYKGGSPAEGEINNWAKTFDPTSSLDTNQNAINAVLSLMGGKLSTISSQYKQVLGNTEGLQILTPQSAQILQSMGLDPTDYDPTYSGNSTNNIGTGDASDFLSTPLPGTAGAAGANYDPGVWGSVQ